MEKLESPYIGASIGMSRDFFTKREIKELWEKVNEIVDWINKREKEDKKNEQVRSWQLLGTGSQLSSLTYSAPHLPQAKASRFFKTIFLMY